MVLIDESTDVAVTKQLIMYVRFLMPTGPVTHFGAILQLQEGTSQVIHKAICDKLKSWNVNKGSLVGFASDGASVVTGVRNGVAARLRNEVPHVIAIHCVAH